ncbi:hypothetical protein T492DRAFT_524464 [Pavlovales sp. CCMP2436]|nr:hypothetical protein T492DRAFT_524464 [Pavlovales sp. CCMP2436]
MKCVPSGTNLMAQGVLTHTHTTPPLPPPPPHRYTHTPTHTPTRTYTRRFDDGESALDVYSRVSSFIATVYRDIDTLERRGVLTPETNIVIISHGLSARTFLMRWFQLSVQMFEQLSNQPNGTLLVMERRENAKGEQWYELTQKSWQLLNLKGTIDSDRVLAHGTGFGSRKLVSSSDSDSLDERLRRRLDDIPIDG